MGSLHGDKGRATDIIYLDRHNGFKIKEGRFRLAIRKKLFTMRAVRPCPRLP